MLSAQHRLLNLQISIVSCTNAKTTTQTVVLDIFSRRVALVPLHIALSCARRMCTACAMVLFFILTMTNFRTGCSQDPLFNDEQVNMHKTRLHAHHMQLNLNPNTSRGSTTQQSGPRAISPTQHRLMVNPALLRAYNIAKGDAKAIEASSQNDWQQCMRRYTANDACLGGCQLMYKDHYHCIGGEHCHMIFQSKVS